MTNTSPLPRQLTILGIILPLAVIIGYLLASPTQFTTVTLVGLALGVLSIPLLLNWHHVMLIASWNAAINVFLLPGQPELWMIMSGVSLGFSLLDRLLTKKPSTTYVPSVVWPLVFLTVVVLVTAKLTGGFGARTLGSSTFGGKRYVYVLAAIIGYFALASRAIPSPRRVAQVCLYFLSGITAMVSNLAFFGGPKFYFLYYVFPAVYAYQQAFASFSVTGTGLSRLTGLAFAAPAVSYFMLLRYGIKGVLNPTKPWRILVYVLVLFAGMFGGFRSNVIMFLLLFAILFFFEGLLRTRWLIIVLVAAVLLGVLLVPFARSLPLPVQRSLSFLPIEVDSQAKFDAQASTEWRLRMWKVLLPEVPKYLLLGKGFAINPTDLYLMQEAALRGLCQDVDLAIVGASYHSGPLTLIIAFGIFGVVGFLWFGGASLRVLYRNYRFSPPELRLINSFLLSYFLMRFVYFWIFYGQFAEDLAVFTGLVGLSISLNGGMSKPITPSPEHVREAAFGGSASMSAAV